MIDFKKNPEKWIFLLFFVCLNGYKTFRIWLWAFTRCLIYILVPSREFQQKLVTNIRLASLIIINFCDKNNRKIFFANRINNSLNKSDFKRSFN